MTTEAIESIPAAPFVWEAKGAPCAAAAAWSVLADAEMAITDLRGLAGLLAGLATADTPPAAAEIGLLARIADDSTETVGEAFREAIAVLSRANNAKRAGDCETEGGPPLPPLPVPPWLPGAKAEGARLAAEGLPGPEYGFLRGNVRIVRWLAGRVAEADGAEAGERLLTLAGIPAADAPA